MRRVTGADDGGGIATPVTVSASSAESESSAAAPRRRRGRVLARVALLLGVLLFVAAPILRFWVTPTLAQAPAEGVLTFTSTGTMTALFDLQDEDGSAALTAPIPITRTVTTTADPAASAEASALGHNVTVTETVDQIVTDDGRLITDSRSRLAADRHTQALVDCCDAAVSGATVTMAGAGSPLRLPWFVPDGAYPYFDTTLLAPAAMTPIGSERVGDLSAVKLQQTTPPTAVGTVPVPGRLVGSEQPTVELDRMHAVTRTLWVDPTTGIILRSAERIRETLRDDAGKDVVTLATLSLASSADQEASRLEAAREQGLPVRWAHTYGPVLCVLASVLLLALGAGLVVRDVRASRVEEDFPDELRTFDDLREGFE